MTTLQHRGLRRETDGATAWNILSLYCVATTGKQGSDKKICKYCLNSDGFIHGVRATRGHPGGNKVDPSLLDNVEIPYMWSDYIYHVGSSLCLHAIIHQGLIAAGKDTKEGRQTVLFTAVGHMTDFQEEE